jgi:hypothetical protein
MPNDQTMQKAQVMLAAFPSCVSPVDHPEQHVAQKKVKHNAF